jgi:hypothetical protein
MCRVILPIVLLKTSYDDGEGGDHWQFLHQKVDYNLFEVKQAWSRQSAHRWQ